MTGDWTGLELIELLKPDERVVVALRLKGYYDREIGQQLGITRAAVTMRMVRARRRLAKDNPELADRLGGRRKRVGM